MTGWKTKAGGVGSIAYGVLILVNLAIGTPLPISTSPTEAIAFITGGFTALGIGHKIEKAAE